MRLYVFRHAWAEPLGPDFMDEEARPLTSEGRERFGRFTERLKAADVEPARIGHSPLVRAQQTAELLAEGLGGHVRLEALEALEPGSDLDAVLEWTAGVPAGDAAWVGHAPDVGEMVAELIGSGAPLDFGAGAMAAIEFDATAARGRGSLLWFVNAKLFGT